MRSAVLFAALAVGSCARVIHKDVFVTEWTTVTVTETVTQWPNAPTKHADAPAPTVDLAKKGGSGASGDSAPAPRPEPEAEAPAPTGAPAEAEPTSSATTSSSSSSAEPIETVTSATTTAPSSTSSLTTSTSTAASSTASGANSYKESILYNHNIHRSDHGADSLTWSDSLSEKAKVLAMRCTYSHDTSIGGGDVYGQNLGYGVQEQSVGKQAISEMMYEDEKPKFAPYYGQASPDMSNFADWGHFTQIVWKNTKEVGCYTYTCDHLDKANVDNTPFTVCNYSPAGNYDGEYADNVLAPSS